MSNTAHWYNVDDWVNFAFDKAESWAYPSATGALDPNPTPPTNFMLALWTIYLQGRTRTL